MNRATSFWLGMAVMFALAMLTPLLLKNRGPLDDTDNKLTGERSNMTILIDHGTGCQYLQTAQGGITPRLSTTGKHRCASAAEAG